MARQRRDPIFIVGLPRAGSTLIEQILSSHSQVEGTMELPDVPALAQTVAQRTGDEKAALPAGACAPCRASNCAASARSTSRARASSARRERPFFIDKMPNNFLHVGLIHLMLPNARIIDARRHPLGLLLLRHSSSTSRAARTSPTTSPRSAATTATTSS